MAGRLRPTATPVQPRMSKSGTSLRDRSRSGAGTQDLSEPVEDSRSAAGSFENRKGGAQVAKTLGTADITVVRSIAGPMFGNDDYDLTDGDPYDNRDDNDAMDGDVDVP